MSFVKKELEGGGELAGDGELTVLPATPDTGKFESILKRNAQNIADRAEQKRRSEEKKGTRPITLFVDPLTAVQPDERQYNPRANIFILDQGMWFEIEDDATRKRRMTAWQLITNTLGEIDESVWKHVKIGNVFELNECITRYLSTHKRADLANELKRRYDSFDIKQGELFLSFTLRFHQLMLDMEAVNLTIDDDLIVEKLNTIMQKSTKDVRNVHMLVSSQNHNQNMSPTDILERMLPLVEMREKHKHKHKNETSGSDSLTSSEDENERQRKKREKRKKRKEKKALALKANASTKNDDDVFGVCLFFQEGKCRNNAQSCMYEHRKLSLAQTNQLREMMAERRSNIICHTCSEPGHIAPHCPKKDKQATQATAAVKVVGAQAASASDPFAEAKLALSKLSDEQKVEFGLLVCAANDVGSDEGKD